MRAMESGGVSGVETVEAGMVEESPPTGPSFAKTNVAQVVHTCSQSRSVRPLQSYANLKYPVFFFLGSTMAHERWLQKGAGGSERHSRSGSISCLETWTTKTGTRTKRSMDRSCVSFIREQGLPQPTQQNLKDLPLSAVFPSSHTANVVVVSITLLDWNMFAVWRSDSVHAGWLSWSQFVVFVAPRNVCSGVRVCLVCFFQVDGRLWNGDFCRCICPASSFGVSKFEVLCPSVCIRDA